ncbi:TlpA family protein disulfide reductase [Marinifilum sp.]|uniref:TlpA family protein disulfide reductase n=1 Tax=Marinifilum sp. TaxID=2033137 RepID=UPI003BA8A922
MNINYPILIILLISSFGCKNKPQEKEKLTPNFFKNLYTQEIYSKEEMQEFVDSLFAKYDSTAKESAHIHFWNHKITQINDSIIQAFKYDFRVGIDYKIRAKEYKRIGMKIPAKKLRTIYGDSIRIGGKQDKPTVINLWFIGCWGCCAEIPALNRLQEKYSGRVNFIALTPDNEKDVRKFVRKQAFNFIHVASKNDKYEETSNRPYIKTIESYPYPETIFVDKDGTIRFVEGMISKVDDIDKETKYFEMIIDNLLNEN